MFTYCVSLHRFKECHPFFLWPILTCHKMKYVGILISLRNDKIKINVRLKARGQQSVKATKAVQQKGTTAVVLTTCIIPLHGTDGTHMCGRCFGVRFSNVLLPLPTPSPATLSPPLYTPTATLTSPAAVSDPFLSDSEGTVSPVDDLFT